MSQTTKVYAIRNRCGNYFPRSWGHLHWTPNLHDAQLFFKLATARGQRTRLIKYGLSRLTIVELTLSNPKVVPDRKS